MSKAFVHMGMKVDAWMVHTRAFRENLQLGGGGETGPDDEIVRATSARIGANVMGVKCSANLH